MMRRTLAVSIVLLYAAAMLAQHSSGGGSSGGGGSHGGSSGGSSSSGGSHTSGGGSASHGSGSSGSSASHGSSSHGSSSHGSSSYSSSGSHGSSGRSAPSVTVASRSSLTESHSNPSSSIREPNAGMRAGTKPTEKRGFFSFLRHPVGKPKPRLDLTSTPAPKPVPVTDLRHRVCLRGPCTVCPTGQVHSGGACVGGFVHYHTNNFCSGWGIWNSAACLQRNNYDDCLGLRTALEQQAARLQSAESAERNACANGLGEECSAMSSTAQSEASLYRELENRYRQCRQRSFTAFPYRGLTVGGYSGDWLFDPLSVDIEYH